MTNEQAERLVAIGDRIAAALEKANEPTVGQAVKQPKTKPDNSKDDK